MKSRLHTALLGVLWAVLGGGLGAVYELIESGHYEGPLDWQHMRRAILTGVIGAVIAWLKQQEALWTPVPATKPESTELKKSAAASAGG